MPRLSADVDVTIRLRHDQSTPAFVSAMRSAGFELRISDVDDFVRRTRVLPFVHRASRIPLDVVLAGPGPEEEFIARARRVSVSGVVVPVLSPEDLIETKVLAGRPKTWKTSVESSPSVARTWISRAAERYFVSWRKGSGNPIFSRFSRRRLRRCAGQENRDRPEAAET